MKNYGAKIFKDYRKLKKLLKLAKTNKYSGPQLAKIFKCNVKCIHGALNRKGIYLPNLGEFKRKYKYNDEFFTKLTPTSAYWLGFIAADGCLYLKNKREKTFYIGLRYSDINHLRKFKEAIRSTGKIDYDKSNNSVCLGFYTCDKIFDSLIKLGITPSKDSRIKKLRIPEKLINHFI